MVMSANGQGVHLPVYVVPAQLPGSVPWHPWWRPGGVRDLSQPKHVSWCLIYPLVSSNMAGWKISELNWMELFFRKTPINGPFSIVMFDYRRVPSGYLVLFFRSTWLNHKVNADEIHNVSLVRQKWQWHRHLKQSETCLTLTIWNQPIDWWRTDHPHFWTDLPLAILLKHPFLQVPPCIWSRYNE